MPHIPAALVNALADRYKVERELGRGGMATVYLARDIRHKRLVALKVIRPELNGTDGVERFLREIELAARLQHPHILPVFDSGTITDQGSAPAPYFVMPYVEGETLRQRIEREPRLTTEVAITLSAELAEALAYAHSHGVIHRDIKPENILLSGGHAVVADFGVARAIEWGTVAEPSMADAAEPAARLTGAGFAVGTPEYMSPEQATGQDIDARADQYSLGCVLYEMLAGEPPFKGPTPQAVLAQNISGPRPHLSRVRPDAPRGLEQLILRATALDPDKRYPDMTALQKLLHEARRGSDRVARRRIVFGAAGALLAVAGVIGLLTTRSAVPRVVSAAEMLAVLPFRISGTGLQLSGEGMMDLLATNLRGVAGITTADPRTVVQRWAKRFEEGTDEPAQALAAARDLQAKSVLLGHAVATDGRARLVADLYQATDGRRLGHAQVDGPLDSVLPLVDRLSMGLLRDVWRSREPLPNLSIASLTTDSLSALQSYLEGERYSRRLAFDSALTAYNRAIEVDSTFALAHLRRALTYGWTGGYGTTESGQAVAAGLRFSDRLPLPSRRLLQGYWALEQGLPSAIDSLRQFVATYPHDVDGWYTYGEALYHLQHIVPNTPENIRAAFDTVLARDSTLTPALIHPIELSLFYRDSLSWRRYMQQFERRASIQRVTAHRVAAGLVWGLPPTDSALRISLNTAPAPIHQAIPSAYYDQTATSDSVLAGMDRVRRNSANAAARRFAPLTRGFALLGLGRLDELRSLIDTVAVISPGAAAGLLGWPIVLGLAPKSSGGARLESLIDRASAQSGSARKATYYQAVLALTTGKLPEARQRIALGLSLADTSVDSTISRGLLEATRGWVRLLEGDTIRGIDELRAGITRAGAHAAEVTGFLRFQLAVVLAARQETRREGILRLRYGIGPTAAHLIPLSYLALGKAYEAAGVADSAVMAYRQFVRLWDKADPDLQDRVIEARAAVQELTRERD
jgi:serine/threonine-protein kinase